MVERAGQGRPLQPRAVATRSALLDAALECLVEQGYAATTTIEVAKRAGVSRGAQLHHFPTRAQLLGAAIDYLHERRRAEFRKAIADAAPDSDRHSLAIDLLWSLFKGPTFVAWAEVWMAARTDPELRVAMVDHDRRFVEASRADVAELLPPEPSQDPVSVDVARAFTLTFLDGLAFRHLVPHTHDVPAEQLLVALRAVAQQMANLTSVSVKEAR